MTGHVHPLAPVLAQAARLISGVTTRWVGCEPEEKQRVYFANHTSHLDAVVLWSCMPGHVRRFLRPVAAADYWNTTPLRSYLARRVFNAVMVERSDHAEAAPGAHAAASRTVLDRMIEALGERNSLILFPEGTRGSGEAVASFKSGLFHLCRARPGLELVPVYLENVNRVLPKGEIVVVPLLCSATFGPPLTLVEGETRSEFLARTREALCSLVST